MEIKNFKRAQEIDSDLIMISELIDTIEPSNKITYIKGKGSVDIVLNTAFPKATMSTIIKKAEAQKKELLKFLCEMKSSLHKEFKEL